MNPQIHHILEDNHNTLRFTLTNANVSIANAIRRVILSEIPVCCIRTDTEGERRYDMCHISINTGRLHNEILKQRLSLIPVHTTDLELLPGKWELVVDVRNDTDHVIYVTTADFKLRKKRIVGAGEEDKDKEKEKEEEEWMPLDQVRKLFPPCILGSESDNFIDFARLRPSNVQGIPGEHLSLVADFRVGMAKENAMYNATSCCSYRCTIDEDAKKNRLQELIQEWRANGLSEEEVKFQAKNFELLDGQRYVKPDSFEFQIQSVGIYSNEQLLWMAIRILRDKFIHPNDGMLAKLSDQRYRVLRATCTIPECWDIWMDQEDYTFGKLLELIVYEEWFVKKQQLVTFCSFKKMHPHDKYGIFRVALKAGEGLQVDDILKNCCHIGGRIMEKLLPK